MNFKRVETLREYKVTWGEKGLKRRRGLTSQYSRENVGGDFLTRSYPGERDV